MRSLRRFHRLRLIRRAYRTAERLHIPAPDRARWVMREWDQLMRRCSCWMCSNELQRKTRGAEERAAIKDEME